MGDVNPIMVAEINSELFILQEQKMKANDFALFEDLAQLLKKYREKKPVLAFIGDMFRQKCFMKRVIMSKEFERIFNKYTTSQIPVDLSDLKTISLGYLYGDVDYSMSDNLFWLVLFILISDASTGEKYFKFRLDESFARPIYYMSLNQTYGDKVIIEIKKAGSRYGLDVCLNPPEGGIFIHF